jgi:hypothetical protein
MQQNDSRQEDWRRRVVVCWVVTALLVVVEVGFHFELAGVLPHAPPALGGLFVIGSDRNSTEEDYCALRCAALLLWRLASNQIHS